MILYKRNTDKEKKQWHLWFAWYPVEIEITKDGDSKYIWLETVQRCGTQLFWDCESIWTYKYKLKENV